MEEPPMLMQRPSSSQSQETSHILMSTFRDIFSQDNINQDMVENLAVSKSGENMYHDKYVEKLQVIHNKWSTKISAIEYMINHLDKAKTQARLLEQQEEAKAKEEYVVYTELGLPSVSSRLDDFIDSGLLRENNLIVPKDFLRYEKKRTIKEDTSNHQSAQYASLTYSSKQRFSQSPSEDNYLPEPGPILPVNSKVGEETKKIHTRKSQATASASDKNIWRNCVTPKQRENEKREISKLQKRADFLKNPRFTTNPKSLTKTPTTENSASCFEPDQYPVVFRDYEVGKSYEIRLELRNVTASCRQVRVLEPTTPYFSVGLGEFPSENGLVAPGMNCVYTITFTPDSLADYDNVLQVKTQSGEPLLIPLQGRREPPDLTLPSELDCGYSLIGSYKTVEYYVENFGGPGRFCFSKEIDDTNSNNNIFWDEINYEEESSIEFEPFTIQPAQFQLDTNESIKIKVAFHPAVVKLFSSTLYLLCDNCCFQIFNVKGTGEIADITLHHVEGGVISPMLEETCDNSAEQIILFNESYPAIVYKKKIHISNTVSVPLQFKWSIHYPSVSKTLNEENTENQNSVFRIEPFQGYLKEQSITTFDVIFTPKDVGSWFDVAALVLQNIPIANNAIFEEKDITSIKLSLKGNAQEFSVVAQPPVVMMSGKHYVGIQYYRTVKLYNHSNAVTTYKWEQLETKNCSIMIDPEDGFIEPNGHTEFLISIIGKKAGEFKTRLAYDIPFASRQQSLYLDALFIGPKVSFQENDLSFGLVRLGNSVEQELTIVNESPVEAQWQMGLKEMDDTCMLTLIPSYGILPANSQQKIHANFQPFQEMAFNSFLQCDVSGSKTCHLPIFCEVQRPHVYIQQPNVHIDDVFIDIPILKTITFCNTTLLQAKCNFVKCNGGDDFEVSVEKISSELDAREHLKMDIVFVFHKLGEVDGVVVFEVDEMIEPIIVFAVYANVKGLIVDVTIPNLEDIENQADTVRYNDVIEFGQNVFLNHPTDALLVIENRSAIETTFDLQFQTFQCARVPTPPTKGSAGVKGRSSHTRPLLMKTSNIGDYTSKTEDQANKEYSLALLRDGKGLGLMCTPSSGVLEAFERKIITVTVYSDMWGNYNDLLLCKVGQNFEQLVPVHCDAIGSPLNFQMTREQAPVVRFGSHPSAAPVTKRSMRINNTSYVDIRLDWQTFVIEPSDEQLIDLSCYYGNPFPLLDEDGSEIVEDSAIEAIDSDDKLIKVILNEHQGVMCMIPFHIDNKQMIVPAQSHTCVDVSFTPPAGITTERNYLGYALGYMSLKNEDRCVGKQIVRLDGLDMLPFGLNMTGCVKAARLLLEACDDDCYTFELCSSSLVDAVNMSVLKETISCSHRFIVSNNSGITVSFKCQLQHPFQLVTANQKTKKSSSNGNRFTLKPNKNVEIRIEFKLSSDLATSYRGNDDILRIEKNLTLEFDNKTCQSYPLVGLVNYPSLRVCKNVVDFGTCFVGERREMNLHISNESKATLYWNIKRDEHCPESSKSVFTIDTKHGRLDSCVGDSPEHSTDVHIGFLAKHNVEYECTMRLTSYFHKKYLNDAGIEVTFKGKGSYDEATREKII